MNLDDVLAAINASSELSVGELAFLLGLNDPEDQRRLFEKAYEIKKRNVGAVVRLRGLVEFSNICEKNCLYCGIRRDNHGHRRYMLDEEEILEAAEWILEAGYGSMVLQSGERSDETFISLIESLLVKIKDLTSGKLGVTLSLGEQTPETYERWFNAGAHRYLLRIETSNPTLYRRIHPADHDFDRRRHCLDVLRDTGYQVGTGVMIGLPGQTLEDLAADALFFKNQDVDMIGMGPYIPHRDAPLAKETPDFDERGQLGLGLKMIAVVRLVLQDANIAATTALQALDPVGRERGLKAGANVMMPNVTSPKYRDAYQLYENKPNLDENAAACRDRLRESVAAVGETIRFEEWGDSPRFFRRLNSGRKGSTRATRSR